MIPIKYSDIIAAQQAMRNVIKETSLMHSKTFSRMAETEVYLKLENLQTTGSFKVRGAFNKLLSLSEEQKQRPIIAASAGNHAQGVAYSASYLGLKSTIFMPTFTPPAKVNATKGYGADVILTGTSFDDAFAASQEYLEEHNGTYIHPFNDPKIIAGQGVVGIEIFRRLPETDTVIVPIGGGGLISGIAIALKEINPNIKIIGVEAEGAASMLASQKSDSVLALNQCHTIADGIAVKKPGDLTFNIVKELVDDIVTVSDKELAHSTYLLIQRGKLLAEPSGTAALAAAIFKKSPLMGQCVVPIISGGNVNLNLFQQIIDQGMMQEGLKAHIQFIVLDQAGELKRVLSILEDETINIAHIIHERSFTSVPVGKVLIEVTVNLQRKEQLEIIKEKLYQEGITCSVIS